MDAALHLPMYITNGLFFSLFFSVAYFLLHRWREKIRDSMPLHVITLSELSAIVSLFASIGYLIRFFGIEFVKSIFTGKNSDAVDWDSGDDVNVVTDCPPVVPQDPARYKEAVVEKLEGDDEEIVKAVLEGRTASYLLESKVGDCKRAAGIRREALQRITGNRPILVISIAHTFE